MLNKAFRLYPFIIAFLFVTSRITVVFAQSPQTQLGNLSYIDPFIGNVGHLLEPTRPTVQLPNQMIRMYPNRQDYMDDQIENFPLNVVSHRLGQVFSIKPYTKQITDLSWEEKMHYDHDLEVIRPWHYTTDLIDEEVHVEFVPGKKAGIFKFDFPQQAEKSILFGVFNDGVSNFKLSSEREVNGMETYHDNIKIYMYGVFNTSVIMGTLPGKNTRVWFKPKADSPRSIEFKYAISYISAEQARKNYDHELKNTTFEQLKAQGQSVWSSVVNQIQVKGGTEAQKRSFYTALYRTYERMTDITEDGRYFSGYDNQIHRTDRPFYVDDWTWDTYLAHHPLRTILKPSMENDMLNSFVKMYEQSGWMPTFPVLFGDHVCMNGFHSSITFLDAYRKGIRNYNVSKAYEGMRKNAMEATMLPWKNGPKTLLDDFYHQKGYFPAIAPGQREPYDFVDSFEKRQSVAVTLGNSYDDWAVGEMAGELGKPQDAEIFKKRAQNYRNLWDAKRQFFLPKDDKGNWIDIDPKFDGGLGGRDYYDENNGWTYMWQVQQDIDGLIDLMGGKKGFEERLDQTFREPLDRSKYAFQAKFPDATGLVGQYSMGNEPSFHIPYLYNFTDAPWKTQERTRFLLNTWFKDNVFGIPGDEDGGGMTAFIVFSSMGFYPVTPGIPVYTIGSPIFEETTINLENGKKFRVLANKASAVNKYIQRAKFNGSELNTPFFSHEQLMDGGTLELEMGPKPNKTWGLTTKK